MPVHLSKIEVEEAYAEGERRSQAMAGRAHLDGTTAPNLRNDREGAAAELAVAVWLNEDWTGKGHTSGVKGDVAGYYEIRWCYSNFVTLKVREHDLMDVPYILVTGQDGRYTIHGWQWGQVIRDIGKELPKTKGWTKRAWAVKTSQIEPMATLPPPGTRPWR